MTQQAPFPYFGGKSKIASEIWSRFGDVANYVEPFFGSGAVLLGRPTDPRLETINDADGYISNFWRSIKYSPAETEEYADWPVNENDLHARHAWLVQRKDGLAARLEGDPDWHDPKIAGWWVWGMCSWIGSGFCPGKGPWRVVDGRLERSKTNTGSGINRQLPHLGDAGQGIKRQRPHLGNAGQGIRRGRIDIYDWFQRLADRLRDVRVCCGDWSRVCGPTPTFLRGLTGVFLDPPYADTAGRDPHLYTTDSLSVAHDVRKWAIENGDNPLMRIALCGYEGEHDMPETWDCLAWKAHGGYSGQGSGSNQNKHRERIWFSPHCLRCEDVTERTNLSLL